MKISEIYQKKDLTLSFEVFPPKGDLGADVLRDVLAELSGLGPDFISVTYSAGGGGNSQKTVELAGLIGEYGTSSIAHLTCINSRREEIGAVVEAMKRRGIENILALRGDRVEGKEPTDFFHATELIAELRGQGFCIGAACYPEGHIENDSPEDDLTHLLEKEAAGAEFFVSQLFFENGKFYRFLERARSRGLRGPVTAGVMPILSKAQISRMIFLCGASLPSEIIRLLNRHENDPEALRRAGIAYAAEQAADLAKNGVDGVHIYTMNQPDIAHAVVERLRADGYVGV